MMTQEGQVNSFKELGEHFLEFVQQSNDTTDPWEVIDDRLDSFYGATIKFPVNSFVHKKDTNSNPSYEDVENVFTIDYWGLRLDRLPYYISANDPTQSKDKVTYPGGGYALLPTYDGVGAVINSGVSSVRYHSSDTVRLSNIAMEFPINAKSAECSMVDYWFHDALYSDNTIYDALKSNDLHSHSFTYALNNLSEEAFNNVIDLISQADVVKLDLVVPSFIYLLSMVDIYFSFIQKLMSDISSVVSSYNQSAKLCVFLALGFTTADLASPHKTQPYWTYLLASYKDACYQYLGEYDCRIYNTATNINFTETGQNFDRSYLKYPIQMRYPALSYDVTLLYLNIWNSSHITDYMTSEFKQYLPVSISYDDVYDSQLATPTPKHPIDTFKIFYTYVSNLYDQINYVDKNSADVESILASTLVLTLKSFYAYISLQYNKITPTTYNDWLTNTKDHYMSETFISDRLRPVWYASSLAYERTTISNQRQNDVANIFKNTGEVLFISPHIKYDKNLWMAEQGGIACDEETRNQAIEDNCIRAHLLRYPISGGIPQLSFQKLPPFPSLGCPMFTIGDDQLSVSRDIGEDAIKYYFVRDNHSASIVIYSRLAGANSGDFGVQHMSFGVLDCFKISEQFMYPLYVAGGNGALDKEHWVYYYPSGGVPQHDVGNIYNLNMSNTSLSNSNLLLSTKFNGANVTNFRVLCPDGHWDNIFNVVQTCSLIVDPDDCHPNVWTPRYYVYNKPEVGGSELGDLKYGGTTLDCGYDNIKRIDTWLINHDYLVDSPKLSMHTEDINASTPLIPVVPTFSSHKLVSDEVWPRHRYGAIGKIPHCYYSWSRWLKFGEFEIDGRKFLAIPCAYNNRLWCPEIRTSVDLASLESQQEEILSINNQLSNYMIYDYVMLELEE